MTNILIIHTPGGNVSRLLQALADPNFCILTADTQDRAQRKLEREEVALIIIYGDSSSLPQISPSETTPMLICPLEETDIDYFLQDVHFIDYLPPPISPVIMKKKVDFLLRVSAMAAELVHSRTTIDGLQEKIGELSRSIEGHNSFLDLMSRRDGLTGLYNRRHFNGVIEKAFANATDRRDDLALAVLNIDYFNEINRSCGQDFGDFVLNELSARLTRCCHSNEVCFRLGGEDFAVLLPSTSANEARLKAEELRKFCQNKPFERGRLLRSVTISIGLAARKAHKPNSHEDLLNMATQALFLAKSEGRNRCMFYAPFDRSGSGTTEQNFSILQESVSRILDKTRTSTIRSLHLLAHGVLDRPEQKQMQQAKMYVELISRHLLFPPTIIETFQNAFTLLGSIRCLLHNEILKKKGTLSAKEWETLTDLPYKLAEITELFDYFSGERTLLLHHGEHFDGSGYPEGLKGDDIPIGARIVNLISAFAAMNSDRPYRRKLHPRAILSELIENAGKQFDPNLVLKLFDVIEEKGILEISKEDLDNARKSVLKLN